MHQQTESHPPALDIGMISSAGPCVENQDAVGARVPTGNLLARKGVAFAIADGVSAAEAGRMAAETCVQNFLGDYFATPDAWSIKRSGGAVLNALNRWLLGQGLRFRDIQRGCVSTFTGCVLHGRQLHVFHIGDTRLYRLRDGELKMLTRDHRVLLHDAQPVLNRAMGLDYHIEIDYAMYEAMPGDCYLLLTDGIHDVLETAALRAILSGVTAAGPQASGSVSEEAPTAIAGDTQALAVAVSAQALCRYLLQATEKATPTDNMSAILVRVNTLPEASPADVLRDWQQLPLLPVLEPGQRIDGLIVERVLAESPRSQVYRVRDEKNGEIHILKSPSPRCENPDAVRREYATENWVLRRVQHPRLPRVSEPPHARSALYLLSAPVEGISLRTWMREHPRAPISEALQIGSQVALALRALHRRDIIHRDVRPENILLDGNGQVTLIDLGQCRVAGLLAERGDDGGGPGALEYAAPECTLHPQHPGERCDQFSLAAMLYEMLTGRLPWDDALVSAHIQMRTRGENHFTKLRLLPASTLNPMVPEWLAAVLARALALEPQRRYGDIAEFSAALTAPLRQGAGKLPDEKPLWQSALKPAAEAARAPKSKSLYAEHPVRFWQLLASLLVIANVITVLLLLQK